jgi:hypothetical protein
MGRDTLKKQIVAYRRGADPYQPGVTVTYANGRSENLRVSYDIFKREEGVSWEKIKCD